MQLVCHLRRWGRTLAFSFVSLTLEKLPTNVVMEVQTKCIWIGLGIE